MLSALLKLGSTWLDYDLHPWQTVRLIDGTHQKGGHVMRRRRRLDRSHEYRVPTNDEEQLWQDVQQR